MYEKKNKVEDERIKKKYIGNLNFVTIDSKKKCFRRNSKDPLQVTKPTQCLNY